MKNIYLALFLFTLILTACETADDRLNEIDHIVPAVLFNADSLEINAGESLTIEAIVTDKAGLQRMEFSYGDWLINEIFDLTEDGFPETYSFSTQINVPLNAKTEWQEDKYFNDGSSTSITQKYHSLSLSVWDINRNFYKAIVHVKVNPPDTK